MAKTKRNAAPAKRAKPRVKTEVKDYRHEEAKRKNNPDVGLAVFEKKQPLKKTYSYDPHKDPQLVWAGKAERLSFDVDTVSLHVHERVSTQAIVAAIKKNGNGVQTNLFEAPDLPFDKAVEFYQHDINWTNRIILGDSLLVMNSLLERELMAGKVQMIYIDPPYGVSYNSNFQPSTRQRDVKDGHDDSLTREPETIKAYRDTWKLGIHSYLAYLRDRLLLCRDLLSESGSIVVQISDENVHRVRCIMDEIFKKDNFVSLITFRKKTGPLGAELLPKITDYLLWYAKDLAKLKFRKLYQRRDVEGDSIWSWVELPDGTRRRMTSDEIDRHSLLPKGSRVFRRRTLSPAGFNRSGTFQVKFEGHFYSPPNRSGGASWTTHEEGMKKLIASKRVMPAGETLDYVYFLEDFPYTELTNVWTETRGETDKVYVVQTDTSIVQRCLLMTTDPGDLVFDPTCGSGTTAYVAEQWGRRWITCDTSRVALSLARQRLMTAVFPYYKLAYPEQGVSAGFVYEEVPHITLEAIANDLPPKKEKLYDKPLKDSGKVRVTGPFTVESIPMPSIEGPMEKQVPETDAKPANDETTNYVLDLIEKLRKTGVHKVGGGTLQFTKLNARSSAGILHAEGDLQVGTGQTRHFAVSFGPQYGPVTIQQVEEAMQEARGKYDGIVFLGFSFDAPVTEFLKRDLPIQAFGAYVNPDVLVGDLLKDVKGSQLFTMFGQADIKAGETKEGFVVEIKGIDLYNPQTGNVESAGREEIAAWFLDEDYDQRSFCICQAFFPGGNNAWEKLGRALKASIDPEVFEKMRGMVSLPFRPKDGIKGKKIAVKVIDHRGNEMLDVFDLEKAAKK